ncbi:MAG: hypothetical protein GY947_13300 [Rhodobacteraceae bacterium]|nr:hypothetical protein [Paracoccaceae bacterium]
MTLTRVTLVWAAGIAVSLIASEGALAVPPQDPLPPEEAQPETSALSEEDEKTDQIMTEARQAITLEDYSRAAQLLTKLVTQEPHQHSADAQELLGVVRERNGQMAHAKAEYDIYLEKYPDGTGAERVRQRLAAIKTAESAPRQKLREAGPGYIGGADGGGGGSRLVVVHSADEGWPDEVEAEQDPKAFKTEISGGVSSYYYYNEGSTRLNEFESRRTTIDDFVFQNALVNSVDLSWSRENDTLRYGLRFSGGYEQDFSGEKQSRSRVSTAYGEVEFKASGTSVRVGRQTRFTGGQYGRFDGVLTGWQVAEKTRLNFVVGSPVDSSRDQPFRFERAFVGANVEFEDILPNWNVTAYVFAQRVGSLVDRQAIGAEVEYFDDATTLYGSLDYDFHFNRVNAFVLSGTHIFEDRSSISASLDYVTSPSLSTLNALIGQTATSLDELLGTRSVSEVKQFALDRTTKTMSANIGYSKPLNDKWQLAVDATAFYTTGNPASGGVAEVTAPGLELFASVHLIGTGIYSENDVVSLAGRYANTAGSDLYLLDLSMRFHQSDRLTLRPRVRMGYRDLKVISGTEFFAVPSVTANYEINRETTFEVELGGRWSSQKTTVFREESNEIFVFAGLRYDF